MAAMDLVGLAGAGKSLLKKAIDKLGAKLGVGTIADTAARGLQQGAKEAADEMAKSVAKNGVDDLAAGTARGGVTSFRATAARHNLRSVTQGTFTKDLNTVIESGVDIAGDVRAINQGLATRVGNTFEINGRMYGLHDGTLFPMSGPAFTS